MRGRLLVLLATLAGGAVLGAVVVMAVGARSTAGAASGAPTTVTNDDVVATVGGAAITLGELDAQLGNKLLRLRVDEYRQRRLALDDTIGRAVLEREARRRGLSVIELLDLEVQAKVKAATEEEAAAVYESAADRFRSLPQSEALRSIADSMTRQRVGQRRAAFTKALEQQYGVKVLLTPPRLPVDASGKHTRGPADAVITIVEFSDYQCPYCGQLSGILREVEDLYPNQIRRVFRDFPLPMHKDAAKAAEAAACANDQGKFWPMHDRLFAGQKSLTLADLPRYAEDAGLQVRKFEACLASGRHASKVREDHDEGTRYGVTGTPSLFVNGRPLFGAPRKGDLVQVIEEELQMSKPTVDNQGR